MVCFRKHLILSFAVLLSLSQYLVHSQHPQIQFSQWWFVGDLKEKQPVGTEVVQVQAGYYTAGGQYRTDGTFQIDVLHDSPDGKFFKVITHSNESISTGSVQTAVFIDKSTANKTKFEFPIWYTTPLNASADAQVTVNLIVAKAL